MERDKSQVDSIKYWLRKIFKPRKLAAFSLLEIMAVVGIVSIALVGTTQLVVQSLRAQNINRSTIIAYQLSQEGIELVRHIRDNNWLANRGMKVGLTPGEYCADYLDPTLKPVSGDDSCWLYLDNNNWYYHPVNNITNSSEIAFRRIIEIRSVFTTETTANIVKVRVTVSWQEGGAENNYVLEAELYDWY